MKCSKTMTHVKWSLSSFQIDPRKWFGGSGVSSPQFHYCRHACEPPSCPHVFWWVFLVIHHDCSFLSDWMITTDTVPGQACRCSSSTLPRDLALWWDAPLSTSKVTIHCHWHSCLTRCSQSSSRSHFGKILGCFPCHTRPRTGPLISDGNK